jgi:hypothetical protein
MGSKGFFEHECNFPSKSNGQKTSLIHHLISTIQQIFHTYEKVFVLVEPVVRSMNTTIVLVAIATFLVAVAIVGTNDVLAPIAILPDIDEQGTTALDLERENDVPGVDEGSEVKSNENSENAAAKIERSTDHDVGGASAAGRPALEKEESIETPNKDIELDIESADQSAGSNSKFVWESVDNPS